MSRQQNRAHKNPAKQVQSLNPWHQRVIELMLHEPTMRQKDRAAELGVTQAWLSQLEGSDMFQESLEVARERHRDLLSTDTIARIRGVTDLTLDAMAEKIERERASLALGELRETATDMLGMLGYGAPRPNSAAGPQVSVAVAVDARSLESARQRMRAANTPVLGPAADPPFPAQLEARAEGPVIPRSTAPARPEAPGRIVRAEGPVAEAPAETTIQDFPPPSVRDQA